jgi:hypothetical protein
MPREPLPNEPLALPQVLAELPDTADYDVVHAALMASEHGRRFLAAYAERNRNADTAMVVGALARVEAAIRGDAEPPVAAAGNLVEIAAALDRIEAAIAAGAPPTPSLSAPSLSAAIERLSDIAFMLHERPLEATLRDALDAAVRDISDLSQHADTAAERARQAMDLLRALAQRVGEMIAQSIEPRGADEAIADHGAAPASGPRLFELTADDGETFAQAVAALAASLPTLADAPGEPAEAAVAPIAVEGKTEPPAVEQQSGQGDAAPTDIPAVTMEQTSEPPQPTPVQQSSADVSLSESVLSEAFFDDHFSSANVSRENIAAAAAPPSEAPPSQAPPGEAALPVQNFMPEPVVGPQEDPGDLFEPQPEPLPPDAAAAQAPPPAAAEVPAPAEPQSIPPPPSRAVPHPPGSDPLAAVRALSEEELIALFS